MSLARLLLAGSRHARRTAASTGLGRRAVSAASAPSSSATAFTPHAPPAWPSCRPQPAWLGPAAAAALSVRPYASDASVAAATAAATPTKKKPAAKKKTVASTTRRTARAKADATHLPPPPPPPPFILSTADGRDPFEAFADAAGEALASAFGPSSSSPSSSSKNVGAWSNASPWAGFASSSASSSPASAFLGALAGPWLTPTQREELVDALSAAWAGWGFPAPGDPAGAATGFGPDGGPPDPRAAAVRKKVLDAALKHVVS
jgi:hypothetical protein